MPFALNRYCIRRAPEPLEVAEARCDAVLADPAATPAQRLAAVTQLCYRGWCDLADAERAIAAWVRDA